MPTSRDWHRAFARAPADVQVMALDTTTTTEEMIPDLELLVRRVRIGVHSGDRGENAWVLAVLPGGDVDQPGMIRVPMRVLDYSDGMITSDMRPIDDIVHDVIRAAREIAARGRR